MEKDDFKYVSIYAGVRNYCLVDEDEVIFMYVR